MIKTVKRVAAFAALALMPLAATTATASAASPAGGVRAAIDCPSGYVCIYPEINFGGQPWVRRAVDGSVKDLPSSIRAGPPRRSSRAVPEGLRALNVTGPGLSGLGRKVEPPTLRVAAVCR
ncbi:peptidase inhibitor family I36 protein (plasmid) [Streptomyces sp. NBC_01591]|uniref:peptidase inhibitor family I36 protein n=1 Tax=Streptomyces sp. NBC_01591 TaxID=2975888 RepID=UPI002DD8CD58|nr:peptidase inhibitor family I36 protein [Streptomyces sp. NBC_01591]WSD73827.1 peptidase inhibitor family I36 protein [Streptomyces sp. NBC_01591]